MKTIHLKTTNGTILYTGRHNTIIEALEYSINAHINLDGLDLSNTHLRNAEMDNIKIRNARFKGADLTGANMSESIFENCDFSDANLIDTCLCYSDLINCNFFNAIFGATDIAETKLDHSAFSRLASITLPFKTAYSTHKIRIIDDHLPLTFKLPIVAKTKQTRVTKKE